MTEPISDEALAEWDEVGQLTAIRNIHMPLAVYHSFRARLTVAEARCVETVRRANEEIIARDRVIDERTAERDRLRKALEDVPIRTFTSVAWHGRHHRAGAVSMTDPITDAALAEIERIATAYEKALVGEDILEKLAYRAATSNPAVLLALIARLRAAERAREAEGWRPIETAPQDPWKPILVGTEAGGIPITVAFWEPVEKAFVRSWGDADPVEWATHWRPLPAPPAPRAEVG
jgi:hypothetical protein